MHLHILVATTNEIVGLPRPTAGNLWKAAVIGCRALETLADDEDLFRQLHSTVEASTRLSGEAKQVFDDLSHFDAFLKMEERCLTDVGIERAQVKSLLKQAREVREQTRDWAVAPGAIRIGIGKLRDETCNMAEQLATIVAGEDHQKQARELLRKVAMGVGGAAIVGANGLAAGTLGQLYTATSILLGGKLIEKAVISSK